MTNNEPKDSHVALGICIFMFLQTIVVGGLSYSYGWRQAKDQYKMGLPPTPLEEKLTIDSFDAELARLEAEITRLNNDYKRLNKELNNE